MVVLKEPKEYVFVLIVKVFMDSFIVYRCDGLDGLQAGNLSSFKYSFQFW